MKLLQSKWEFIPQLSSHIGSISIWTENLHQMLCLMQFWVPGLSLNSKTKLAYFDLSVQMINQTIKSSNQVRVWAELVMPNKWIIHSSRNQINGIDHIRCIYFI